MIKETKNITVEQAQSLLTDHVNRRPLKEAVVEAIAADMEAGTFDPTLTFVVVNAEGRLLFGQHTLAAIVRMGKAQQVGYATTEPTDPRNHGLTANRQSPYEALYAQTPATPTPADLIQ